MKKAFAVAPLLAGILGLVLLRCGSDPAVPTVYKAFLYVVNNMYTTNTVHPHALDLTTGAIGAKGTEQTPASTSLAIAVHPSQKFVYVAGYSSITAYTVAATTGELTAMAGSPFVDTDGGIEFNRISFARDGKFLLVGRGSFGKISVFSINATSGALTPVAGSPFTAHAGEYGGVMNPKLNVYYQVNQADSTVSAWTVNADGTLTEVGSPTTTGVSSSPYGVTVTGDGTYIFTADTGGHKIATFALNATTGAITAGSSIDSQAGLQDVYATPSGKFLYATISNGPSPGGYLEAYTINATDGHLTAIAGSPFAMTADSSASNVLVDPSSRFVYVSHPNGTDAHSQVNVYAINATTGVPTVTAGSPFEICFSIMNMAIGVLAQP